MVTSQSLIVEHATDALSLHGASGVFEYVSPGFIQLLGYDDVHVLGRFPNDLFHPDDVDAVLAAYEELLEDRSTFRISYRLRRADGTYLWVESCGRAVVSSGGCLAGVVAITRDIEIRRSLMEALAYEQRLRDRLDAVAAQQHHFLTAVAHRTRTPMTAVLGFAHTLHHSGDRLTADRRRELIERLITNAQRLAGIVEDATDLEALARSKGALTTERCELSTIVHRALRQLADPSAPVEVSIDPPDLSVWADPLKLDRALRCLIRNAIAHTPTHTPFAVRVRRCDPGVVLSVEDRGPGVRDALKESIFEPFTKGDSYLPHDPGLGLGLSIVAHIAREHGGRTWVSDVPGGGAAFHLELPDPATA